MRKQSNLLSLHLVSTHRKCTECSSLFVKAHGHVLDARLTKVCRLSYIFMQSVTFWSSLGLLLFFWSAYYGCGGTRVNLIQSMNLLKFMGMFEILAWLEFVGSHIFYVKCYILVIFGLAAFLLVCILWLWRGHKNWFDSISECCQQDRNFCEAVNAIVCCYGHWELYSVLQSSLSC